MTVKLMSACICVYEQFATENAELQLQVVAMKETQQEFIAEVWFGCLFYCGVS